MDQRSVTSEESARRFLANPGILGRNERWWPRHHKWLEDSGYKLRPRFHPDWKPSWTSTKTPYYKFEDGQNHPVSKLEHPILLRLSVYASQYPGINDATRISDGTYVMLKRILRRYGLQEVEVHEYLRSKPLVSDPRNHTIPIHEILRVPDEDMEPIIVMPLLRRFDSPRFETYGEVIAFLSQLFEVSYCSQFIIPILTLGAGNTIYA